MSTQVGTVQKKAKCEVKGLIRKGGKGKKKIYIIINDKVYFVSTKAVKDVLEGTKEKSAIRGYD